MLSQNGGNAMKQSPLGRPVAGLVTLVAVALLLAAAAAPLAAQAPTHKQTDKLVSRAHYVIGSLKTARMQIKTTLNEYNAIIDGKTPDNRAAYKKLNKDIGRSEKRAADVRGEVESMEKVASKYFADWESSLDDFTSPDMRKKSEDRLHQTMSDYGEILKAGKDAGEEFRPFVSELKDQVLFLGNDLSPAGIAELQDEAEEINSRADDVFAAVDELVKTASRYASSLK